MLTTAQVKAGETQGELVDGQFQESGERRWAGRVDAGAFGQDKGASGTGSHSL